jgi:large subunit ribosomal protein L9
VHGLTVTLIRQAGDSGSLYGSVSSRDIADGATAGGLQIDRGQVELDHPIKTLGVRQVRVVLHPEVVIHVTVNVARSAEEAEKQLRGEAVGRAAGEEPEPTSAELFGTDEATEAA